MIQDAAKKEWLIVVGILAVGVLLAVLLNVFKPEADKKPVKDNPPMVEFVSAIKQAVSIPVFSQGSVNPKTHIKVIAEVSGQVVEIAQIKNNGGFFKQHELLLRIDETDYQLAITKAKAQVAAARQQLIRVETEAAQAKYDLKQLGRKSSSSTAYALREPHLAEAKANLQAAQADLKISQLQLERTKIKAPFDGRVVGKQVDIGQYVSPGTLLAEIYSTEKIEVRLPISLQQAELLGISLANNQLLINAMKVILSSDYSGRRYEWEARLSHIEGELSARNQLIYVVAEVNNPYLIDEGLAEKPVLTPGMFVKAKITGLEKSSVVVLPRVSLRYGNEVWVIDDANKLQKKKLTLHAKDRDFIYVESGIHAGDRIITNNIDYPVEGMNLSIDDDNKSLGSDEIIDSRINE